MNAEFKKAYDRHVPRWFKVIRWREIAIKRFKNQNLWVIGFYIPVLVYYTQMRGNPYPYLLIWFKPDTQEEIDYLKKMSIQGYGNHYVGRNWEMDQYHGQVPPYYDVWERRKKYPEYYGDKYNTFARDAYCDSNPNGHP